MIALILKSERQVSGASSFRISSSVSDPLPPAPDSLSHHLPVHVICVRSLVSPGSTLFSLPVRAPKLTLYHVAAAKSRYNYCFHHSDLPCLFSDHSRLFSGSTGDRKSGALYTCCISWPHTFCFLVSHPSERHNLPATLTKRSKTRDK